MRALVAALLAASSAGAEAPAPAPAPPAVVQAAPPVEAKKPAPPPAPEKSTSLGPDSQWAVVEGSDALNYYKLKGEDGRVVFHANYFSHVPTVTLGRKVPEAAQDDRTFTWSWRVHQYPVGSDERDGDKEDSALAVYLTFGTALHRQSIKYVWSATLPKGTVIGPSNHFFYEIVTVVLEGKGPTNQWKDERVDVAKEWARFYAEPGQTAKDAPPLSGVGILTDGDDTRSHPSADYADFRLSP